MNRFTNIFAAVLVAYLSLPCWAQSDQSADLSPDQIAGSWVTPAFDALLTISIHNHKANIHLASTVEPNQRDGNNPDAALQNRELKNLLLGNNFVFKRGWWRGGTIYDPNTGKTFKAKIKRLDQDTLEIRAYIGASVLGRTIKLQSKSSVIHKMVQMLGLTGMENTSS